MRKAILIVACLVLSTSYVNSQHTKSDDPLGERAKATKKRKPKPRTDPYLVPIPPDEILFGPADYAALEARKGWRLIDGDDNGTSSYYDKDRLTPTNGTNIKQGWVKFETRKEGILESYFLTLDDFDCGQKRTRAIQIVEYDKSGMATNNADGDRIWKAVIPDSMGERVHGVICLNWPDDDELNMRVAAEDFAKARQLEKKAKLDDARIWYELALKSAPNRRKIIDAILRMPPK